MKGLPMLLEDFFETVYLPRRLRGKSENSARLYRLCIRQLGKTLGRRPKLADLTEDTLLRHLARRSDVSPATRNKELAELTAMWRLAVQKGMHTGWPDLPPEHEPERAPIAWLPEELRRLLAAARRQQGMIGPVPAGRWWHAFLALMLDTGERVSAVRQADRKWLQGEWIQFPAEARKGKTRDKSYKMSKECAAAIDDLRQFTGDRGPIFPWPFSETYLWQKYRVILKDAGLPSSRKHAFHAIRKTHGSIIFAAGHDPQKSLDHSDSRTTARYLDARYVRDKQPSEILEHYLKNPTKPPQTPPNEKDAG